MCTSERYALFHELCRCCMPNGLTVFGGAYACCKNGFRITDGVRIAVYKSTRIFIQGQASGLHKCVPAIFTVH